MTLTHLTGADFLQQEHTALIRTVGLKLHTTPVNPYACIQQESATVVSEILQKSVLSDLCGGCSEHIEPLWCNHAQCDNEVTWEDRVWNPDYHWLARQTHRGGLGARNLKTGE